MFCSLAQTLFCVLLIQGGLYALHLSGNGNSNNNNNNDKSLGEGTKIPGQPMGPSSSQLQLQLQQHQQHQQQHQQQLQHPGGSPPGGGSSSPHNGHRSAAAAAFDATTVRLNKEIADMAQLERERLMLLARAKQTAEQPPPAGGNQRGHPFIAGRIQMQPSEELDVGDYPALLQQAARGYIFGSVQKQPPTPLTLEQDYEQLRELENRPVKYYGRVVQPAEREEREEALYEPLHSFGDFDDFSELEQEQEPHMGEDELLRELDAYQYHGLEEDPLPENPYRTLEQLELNAPDSLQQLFEQEQRDAPAKGVVHSNKNHNPGGYNIRVQQKWARKRNGQGVAHNSEAEKQLQRQIFAQHFKPQRNGKLSLSANSEATATKHLKPVSRSGAKDAEKSNNELGGSASGTGTSSGKQTAEGLAKQQQEAEEQQAQDKKDPSHKRSGAAGGSPSGGYPAQPPVSHSIASQLMLRTARGQRQYDVPQIECPTAMDGMERFACPIPDRQGRYRCIDDHVLCDGFIDCPDGEDEDRRSCMFYKTTKAHLDVLADALLRWARGR
ncbi:putative uncharacterized protein DDB_G0271606 [Drosophila ficusphila]|uniref:putative uncharacterized protein DDB_G0271606 n=1 Tax=Drosophila ficusphila TaxID=30025 RepID=UPI0007E86B83|nr:putative uncharacterized protein DDB_G0271606 [Drosophila ficusphila]